MRELKFRAWNGVQMLHTDNGDFHLMNDGSIDVPSSTGHEFNNKKYPVMQFTGLPDKNGTEIYEGDILKCHDHPTGVDDCTSMVVYNQGCFVMQYNGIPLRDYGSAWVEVIGNIHQINN